MIYTGGCHCGQIAFEVEGELKEALACNCSICTKKGYLLWFVPRKNLRLSTPEAAMSTYLFNHKVIQHRFCSTCGCGPFGEAVDPKTNEMTAAVNVRCLNNIDLDKLKLIPFDGRKL